MEIEKLEGKVDELKAKQEAGEDVQDDLRQAEADLLAALRESRKKPADPAPEPEPVDDANAAKIRELFVLACDRAGVNPISAEAMMGSPSKLIKYDERSGSFSWHTGSSIGDGFRAEVPPSLLGTMPGNHDSTPAGELRQKIAQAERDLEVAMENARRNNMDNACLAIANRLRNQVKQLKSELADLDPKPVPKKVDLSPAQITRLRTFEVDAEKARRKAQADPNDRNMLSFNRAKNALKSFKRELGIT